MSQQKKLEAEAISAAKSGAWDEAILINQEILTSVPGDINALNRLGFAYLQKQKLQLASRAFQEVLKLEKSNPIALKQLQNIKAKNITAPGFGSENIVEEPSKAKIIDLHRLASKQALTSLKVGQELVLKPKNRFISVETLGRVYLGSLPEDISLHLSELIKNGNQYQVLLHSCSNKHCKVFVKETYQAPANRHYHSFMSNYHPEKDAKSDDEDLLLLADEVPLNIVDDETESLEGGGDTFTNKDP